MDSRPPRWVQILLPLVMLVAFIGAFAVFYSLRENRLLTVGVAQTPLPLATDAVATQQARLTARDPSPAEPITPQNVDDLIGYEFAATGRPNLAMNPAGDPVFLNGELYSVVSGQVLHRLAGYERGVAPEYSAAAFHPDGSVLVTLGDEWQGQLWDVRSGQRLPVEGLRGYGCAAFSPDGALLASCSGPLTHVWETATYHLQWELQAYHNKPGYQPGSDNEAIAFSPDSHQLAVGDGLGFVTIWDVQTGEIQQVLEVDSHRITFLAYSQDGRRLMTLTIYGREQYPSFQVWSLPNGERLLEVVQTGLYFSEITVHPMENLLATAGRDGVVRLWTLEGTLLREIQLSGPIRNIAFSADGTRLIALKGIEEGEDFFNGVWIGQVRGPDESLMAFQGHEAAVTALAFSADGRFLVSGGEDSTVRQWDGQTGAFQRIHEEFSAPVHYVTTAQEVSGRQVDLVAIADNRQLYHWDLASGREFEHFDLPGRLDPVALSPDGHYMTFAQGDYFRLAQANTTQLQRIRGDADHIHSVAFSPDSRALAYDDGQEHTLQLVDLDTLDELWEIELEYGSGRLVFSPDGRLLASSDRPEIAHNSVLSVFEVATGTLLYTLPGTIRPVSDLAFSVDGHFLVVADGERAIWLYDLATGTYTLLEGHLAPVHALAVSPTGLLASGDSAGEIRFWALGAFDQRAAAGSTPPPTATLTPTPTETPAPVPAETALPQALPDLEPITAENVHRLTRVAVLPPISSEQDGVDTSWGLQFSPDGSRLVLTDPNTGQMHGFDPRTGTLVYTVNAHRSRVSSQDISATGMIATGGGQDNLIRLWDMQTGAHIRDLGEEDRYSGASSIEVLFDSTGRYLLAQAENRVKAWDVDQGVVINEYANRVILLGIVPESHDLLLVDRQQGDWILWDFLNNSIRSQLPPDWEGMTRVQFTDLHTPQPLVLFRSPTGPSGEYDHLGLWNPATGRFEHSLRPDLPTVDLESTAVSSSDLLIMTHGNSRVSFWDLRQDTLVTMLVLDPALPMGGAGSLRVALSPDHRLLATWFMETHQLWLWGVPAEGSPLALHTTPLPSPTATIPTATPSPTLTPLTPLPVTYTPDYQGTLVYDTRHRGETVWNNPDVWTFAGEAGQSVLLSVRPFGSQEEVAIRILNAQGQLIGVSEEDRYDHTVLSITLPTTGEYTILIEFAGDLYHRYGPVNYELTIRPQ